MIHLVHCVNVILGIVYLFFFYWVEPGVENVKRY